MYKVDNAIIMAAGLSSRLYPLTYDKPKGLVEVKSEILIERLVRQLIESGIKEIVIVGGHQKEKYYYLKEKYGVIVLDNPYYKERNNYSSLYVAKDYLKNSYICVSDIYYIENLFFSQEEKPFYLNEFHKEKTNEWCLDINSKDKIVDYKVSGDNAWVLNGHAFFTSEFSNKFKEKLEETFKNTDKNNYFWEDVYFENTDDLSLYSKKIEKGLLYEFDSLDELRHFDVTYKTNTRSKILKDIAAKLDIHEKEIKEITPLGNPSVTGFSFVVKNKKMEYDFIKGLI